jgi:hypothetical protein
VGKEISSLMDDKASTMSDSSDTSSVSSFMSALSSQGSRSKEYTRLQSSPTTEQPSQGNSLDSRFDPVEAVSASNYVDLHDQMNRPITKSHLLMSCYRTHMTKLKCSHWSAHGPHPHNDGFKSTDVGKGLLTRQNSLSADPRQSLSWIPQFEYVREGFTPSLMVNKR